MGPSEGSFLDRHVRNASQERLMLYGVTLLAIIVAIILVIAITSPNAGEHQEHKFIGHEVLITTPLVDGSNYLPAVLDNDYGWSLKSFNFDSDLNITKWKTDLPRLSKGMIGTQVWTVKVPCEAEFKDVVQRTLMQIDTVKKLVAYYPQYLQLVTSAEGIKGAFKNQKIGNMIGISGGYAIDNKISVLRAYYDLGVRYLTLAPSEPNCTMVWNTTSEGSETQPRFNESVITEMNRLGMVIDLSHSSKKEQLAVLNATKAPAIYSCAVVTNNTEQTNGIQDDVLAEIKRNGGLIMVSFNADDFRYEESQEITIANVTDNINYIKKNCGVNCVGIGAGFHNFENPIKGLEDSSKYPDLFDVLANNTEPWTEQELQMLAGDNFYRVLKAVEKVKNNLSSQKPEESIVPADALTKDQTTCYTKLS